MWCKCMCLCVYFRKYAYTDLRMMFPGMIGSLVSTDMRMVPLVFGSLVSSDLRMVSLYVWEFSLHGFEDVSSYDCGSLQLHP